MGGMILDIIAFGALGLVLWCFIAAFLAIPKK
jgi:hypothetical protein